MQKLDLNLLRVLLAIHDTGSVTAAAARLKMSQPAASAALGRLRAGLDDALFVRHADGMLPTPRAGQLVARAREVLATIDRDILRAPAFDPATAVDEMVFCLSAIGEVVFLPQLFGRLRAAAPSLRVRSVSLAPAELEQALGDGQVDLALGYFPDLRKAEFVQRRLFSHDLVCLVREGHAIRGPRMTLRQFERAEHAFVKDGSRTQEMFEDMLVARGMRRNVVLHTAHYMSIPAIIAESDLVVVLPRTVAAMFAGSAGVRVVMPPVDMPRYDLKMYWHRRFGRDPKVAWLRQEVARTFAAEP